MTRMAPPRDPTPPLLSTARKSKRMAAKLTGRISQMPPAYSAKKIHGKPAHELARKNKPVELKAVEVEVYEFRVEGRRWPARASGHRMLLRNVYPLAGA